VDETLGQEPTTDETDAAVTPKEYDANGNLVVKLSGRATATIRELNGHESLVADSYMGSAVSPLAIAKVYALLAIQSLTMNGQPYPLQSGMKNLAGCFQRAKVFTARELLSLMDAYANEYMSAPTDEETLKNSSTLTPE
jgi:hypothetical protein